MGAELTLKERQRLAQKEADALYNRMNAVKKGLEAWKAEAKVPLESVPDYVKLRIVVQNHIRKKTVDKDTVMDAERRFKELEAQVFGGPKKTKKTPKTSKDKGSAKKGKPKTKKEVPPKGPPKSPPKGGPPSPPPPSPPQGPSRGALGAEEAANERRETLRELKRKLVEMRKLAEDGTSFRADALQDIKLKFDAMLSQLTGRDSTGAAKRPDILFEEKSDEESLGWEAEDLRRSEIGSLFELREDYEIQSESEAQSRAFIVQALDTKCNYVLLTHLKARARQGVTDQNRSAVDTDLRQVIAKRHELAVRSGQELPTIEAETEPYLELLVEYKRALEEHRDQPEDQQRLARLRECGQKRDDYLRDVTPDGSDLKETDLMLIRQINPILTKRQFRPWAIRWRRVLDEYSKQELRLHLEFGETLRQQLKDSRGVEFNENLIKFLREHLKKTRDLLGRTDEDEDPDDQPTGRDADAILQAIKDLNADVTGGEGTHLTDEARSAPDLTVTVRSGVVPAGEQTLSEDEAKIVIDFLIPSFRTVITKNRETLTVDVINRMEGLVVELQRVRDGEDSDQMVTTIRLQEIEDHFNRLLLDCGLGAAHDEISGLDVSEPVQQLEFLRTITSSGPTVTGPTTPGQETPGLGDYGKVEFKDALESGIVPLTDGALFGDEAIAIIAALLDSFQFIIQELGDWFTDKTQMIDLCVRLTGLLDDVKMGQGVSPADLRQIENLFNFYLTLATVFDGGHHLTRDRLRAEKAQRTGPPAAPEVEPMDLADLGLFDDLDL